jgi:aldose 1-epimerase
VRIEAVTLSNSSGVRVRIMTLGAALQSPVTPDRNGRSGDVVLGFDSAQEYLQHPGYFGAAVGRFANRVAKARFNLDGHDYMLAPSGSATGRDRSKASPNPRSGHP